MELLLQSDNSRKEGRTLALSCTPEEKQSVAARAAAAARDPGVAPTAKQDLWLS